jgi:hypothetical protein
LRHMVVIAQAQRRGNSEPFSDDPVEGLAQLGSVTRRGKPPGKALADLSAPTRRVRGESERHAVPKVGDTNAFAKRSGR